MNTPDPSQFDAHAAEYDAELQRGLDLAGENKEYFAEARVGWVKKRLAELGFAPASILDYGCGTGSAAPYLLSHFPDCRLSGVDVSAQSIHLARKQFSSSRASFHLVNDLQPKAEFELAFCNGVFHHIPPAERPQAVAYVLHSLRPGGLFAFWENNPWNPGTRFVMSRIPFDRDAITLSPSEGPRLLRQCGFEVLCRDSLFYFPRSLSGLRFLEPALVRLPFGGQYLLLCRKEKAGVGLD